MSTYHDINALKQSSVAEIDFIKQLREGLSPILNGMEVESYRRGDALEQRLRGGGYLRHSTGDLEVKVRQLETEENRLLRRQAEVVNAAQQIVSALSFIFAAR